MGLEDKKSGKMLMVRHLTTFLVYIPKQRCIWIIFRMVFVILTCVFYSRRCIPTDAIYYLVYFLVSFNKCANPTMDV